MLQFIATTLLLCRNGPAGYIGRAKQFKISHSTVGTMGLFHSKATFTAVERKGKPALTVQLPSKTLGVSIRKTMKNLEGKTTFSRRGVQTETGNPTSWESFSSASLRQLLFSTIVYRIILFPFIFIVSLPSPGFVSTFSQGDNHICHIFSFEWLFAHCKIVPSVLLHVCCSI